MLLGEVESRFINPDVVHDVFSSVFLYRLIEYVASKVMSTQLQISYNHLQMYLSNSMKGFS